MTDYHRPPYVDCYYHHGGNLPCPDQAAPPIPQDAEPVLEGRGADPRRGHGPLPGGHLHLQAAEQGGGAMILRGILRARRALGTAAHPTRLVTRPAWRALYRRAYRRRPAR